MEQQHHIVTVRVELEPGGEGMDEGRRDHRRKRTGGVAKR
jgi:hypothetical protein